MSRVPVEVPLYTIAETTTFWSQDELVALVRNRRPDFDFENMNKPFKCTPGSDCLILQYGGVKVGEFGFGSNYDYDEDMPKWEEENGKFRVYIGNFHGYRGTQAPENIHIRLRGYDTSMKLGWKYTKNKDSQDPEIEIFRVDDDNLFKANNVVYTLRHTDFNANGKWWMDARNPIVIQKHNMYVTICASAHLKRTWAGELADRARTLAQCVSYIMSDDEVAWISRDNPSVLRSFIRKYPSAPAEPDTVGALLATLHELASD